MQTKQELTQEILDLMEQHKSKQAIGQMLKSEHAEDIYILKLLSEAYIREGRYEAAKQTLIITINKGLDKDELAWAFFCMARILRCQDKPKKAGVILKKLVKDYPEKAQYWSELGRIYNEIKDSKNSEMCHQKALSLIKSHTDKRDKAQICVNASQFYSKQGNLGKAIRLLKIAVKLFPTDHTYLLPLADCYFENDNLTKAREIYQKVKEYYPNEPEIQGYVDDMLSSGI